MDIVKRKKAIAACVAVMLIIVGGVILVCYNKQWDRISAYRGLTRKEITLSKQMQEELNDLIWNFDYSEVGEDSVNQLSAIYGGEFFVIEFQSGDTVHEWLIDERQIRHYVYRNGTEMENYIFEGNAQFIEQMKRIIYS